MLVRETASLEDTPSSYLCTFRAELVCSVASRLADTICVEIVDYILSDSRNILSLEDVH